MTIASKTIWSQFIQRKLLLIIFLATLLTGSFLLIDYLGTQILSTLRAYVHGESAYSKGQKNALIHLMRYINSHNPARYEKYRQQIAIPIADKHARLELEKQNPDLFLAQQWYIRGGNHPHDVEQMARLFTYLKYFQATRQVLELWREADGHIEKLDEHASIIHTLIETKQADNEQLNGQVAQILGINEQLTLLEEQFSASLGQIARQTERALFSATCLVSFGLLLLFSFVVTRTFRHIKGTKEKYRTLFEESLNGILLSSAEGKLTEINPMGGWLLDLEDSRQVSSYSLAEVFAKFRNGEALYERFLAAKQLENVEIEILQQETTKAFALLNVIAQYESNGRIHSYRTILRNITDQKLAEQVLATHCQELKKINTELDSFVYRASHDLRAPLASILGLIEISKPEVDLQQRTAYLQLMSKSVHKLDNFIKNIISYSKNTRLEPTAEPIDFSKLISEVLDDLHYMEGVDKIAIQIKIEAASLFYSDPFRLQILFSNFISNAIKYRKPIAEPYLQIKIETSEQKAIIEFIDNGIGIEKEAIDKIFNMFYRATEQNAGSGLGLYIAKEALNFLKGSIKVDSQVGKGTHFTLELPSMVAPAN
ncbi:HAMP domain-containing sensor histidine kinase [Rhodocytophaga aerolata]|uniref:histidine kinase n=1 Tax=Rhodocytophaga aerolata TaxID=455078 RepID=A0ABT8RF01_9BACT|nr:HAMP domain-containing sensor histidine kinase [Rhodocytophaga aerolata]MDO1450678.1 HAMP domain-containing sensor histidine kinase [Rhodocytophaga aerolata]